MANKITLVYFSGTGGVERIAGAFDAELQKRGYPLTKINLDRSKAANNLTTQTIPQDTTLLILLYPVYAFDAPKIVYSWLTEAVNQWPQNIDTTGTRKSNRLKTAVISVSGGGETWPNTGCRMELCKTLEAKGLQVVYEKMMVMPANCITRMNNHLSMLLIQAVPEKSSKILDSILSGRVRRTRFFRGPFKRLIAKSSKEGFSQFAQGLEITDQCNSCGYCSANCPVANISMEAGKPVFSGNCIMCLRCVYNCPRKALLTKVSLVFKEGFRIPEIERKMEGVELKPVKQAAKGLVWIGVRNYLLDKDGY